MLQDLFDRQARIDALRTRELLAVALRVGLPVSLGFDEEGTITWLDSTVEPEPVASTTTARLRVPNQKGITYVAEGTEVIVFVRVEPDGLAFPSTVTEVREATAPGREGELGVTIQRGVVLYRFQRRATVRVQPHAPPPAVTLTGGESGQYSAEGQLLDVSMGGAQVLIARMEDDLSEFLATKPELTLTFVLPLAQKTTVQARGHIAWLQPDTQRARGTRLGVQWADLTEPASVALAAFVASERKTTLRVGLEAIRTKGQRLP